MSRLRGVNPGKRSWPVFGGSGPQEITVGFELLVNDVPTADPAIVAERLIAFWAPTFTATQVDDEATNNWARAIRKPGGDPTYPPVPYEQFAEMVKACKDSAPGPDGVRYACYAVNEFVIKTLFDCYDQLLQGVPLPDNFNNAWPIFIPKTKPLPGERNVIAREKELRPLSLSSTDAKIISKAVLVPIADVANNYIDEDQRGNVKGRLIITNVADIEAYGLEAASVSKDSAISLLDYAAAFPSLAHAWIFAVLTALGVPTNVVEAIQQLYLHNTHRLRLRQEFLANSRSRAVSVRAAP